MKACKETFNVGAKVKWVSQAQGCAAKKVGLVVEVVRPGRLPETSGLDNCGGSRKVESYVIEVPGKTSRAKVTVYWPVQTLLKAARANEQMGKSYAGG